MGVILNEEEWFRFMQKNREIVFDDKKKAWRSLKRAERDLDILDSYSEAICLDTETTGTSHKDQIIQFSAIRISLPEYTEMERIDVYIKPDKPIRPIITEVTGITNEFLEDKPSEKDVFPIICDFLGIAPLIIAYNTPFDRTRLEDLYMRNGDVFESGDSLDVMEMAKDLVQPDALIIHDGGKYDDGKPHYKQEFVAPLLGADEGLSFHSAIDDTIAVLRLLRIFTEKYKVLIKEMQSVKKEKVVVENAYYWENPYMKRMIRFRVFTNLGEIFLDCWTKQWGTPKKKESQGLLEFIDMEDVQAQVFRMWHVSSIEELISVAKASRKNYMERKKFATA